MAAHRQNTYSSHENTGRPTEHEGRQLAMPSATEVAPTLAATGSRALGAYYTPSIPAALLTQWALRQDGDRILEPSMGDGSFLGALRAEGERRGLQATVWGVELAEDTYGSTVASGVIEPPFAIRSDFLAVEPFEVDAVLGNPPYVRLRHLPRAEARRAQQAAEATLGHEMDPSGSIWMPFVLHATRFLARGGRLALVLPFDLTYVRYARPLWAHLMRHFGTLKVVRVHERMFPEILQEIVLLLADEYGGQTQHVDFEAFHTLDTLHEDAPSVAAQLNGDNLIAGDRVFLESLMPKTTQSLVRDLSDSLVPARDLVRFNIGYVCGDKRFFHPDEDKVRDFDIPASSLRPSLTAGRQLRGAGIRTSSVAEQAQMTRLFLPPGELSELTSGEKDYVNFGEDEGVSNRYKCRIRDPWYVTPYVRVPDVVLPVFADRPALILNDAGVVVSNSLLCGYMKSGTAESLANRWYTSLTLLQIEQEVHSLGGGVMVLVPREAGSINLVRAVRDPAEGHLEQISRLLQAGRLDEAFRTGDNQVLRSDLGLTGGDIESIENAGRELRWWRNAVQSSRSPKR